MAGWIDAFGPTFALIGLGFFLRNRVLREASVWAGLEWMTFWLLLPALLCAAISTVDLARLPLGGLALALWSAIAVGAVAAFGLARALGQGHASATSTLQGTIRFNNFTAFSIVGGLHGPPGVALGGIAAGLMTPLVQLVVTTAFTLGGGRSFDPLRLLRQIGGNPILIGCALGFAFAAGGGMPPGIGPFVRALGQASLAVGLLCVGAALAPASLREFPGAQALVGLVKLALLPLVTLTVARSVGLDPATTAVAVMFMAMPTAPTSYVQARAMGGDARLMAAIITLQHGAALVTLPAWAWALGR